jgi:hypothetical protein
MGRGEYVLEYEGNKMFLKTASRRILQQTSCKCQELGLS